MEEEKNIDEEIIEELENPEQDIIDLDSINQKINLCLRNIKTTKQLEERISKVEKDFIEFIKG